MLAGLARRVHLLSKLISLPKAGAGAALSSILLLGAAGTVHDATALGDTRTLSFHHTHSGEDLTVTFKRSGRYDEEALKKLNHFLRDWRNQDQTVMDRSLFDILWEVYRDVDGKQPIQIISAYRSPATNAMLRRRSSGVARHSQHMLGHAMDFFIPGVPLEQIRFAGLRLQRGGVGFYPTSGSPFVHLDTGNIRHWPRMTADQLARVFPDGRTVHLPTSGKPLKNYELALADIQKRGKNADGSSDKQNLLAALFGRKGADDEDEGTASVQVASADSKSLDIKSANDTKTAEIKTAETKTSETKTSETKTADAKADPVPMPRAKPASLIQLAAARPAAPAKPIQVASADAPPVPPMPVPTARPADADSKPQSPADIINARGFWDDMPAAPKQATPAQVAAVTARQALAAADRTTSIEAMNAMAYAPVDSSEHPRTRVHTVTASAPIPRGPRAASLGRAAAVKIDSVIAKAKTVIVATSARLTAAGSRDNDVWMRAMILMPSAIKSAATVIGDIDMTLMSRHFVKPETTLAMAFVDDPQPGLYADSFTGPAVATLTSLPLTATAESTH
ncbi:DUF882 domain-containing protein [Rhodopseudomonas sp. B29]|uniref:DUF882 domain-containing protein n=1 Tax=Rhodopseudomonas sp. B29 TaxID=95607 RepID=UPI000593818C|nr:DUF882 domain-containing protein [Rhodopseudomonas sp. B29]